MKILLVGNGGREHALAWQFANSRLCESLYCAPGNAGIAECAECVDIAADDLPALVTFAKDKNIDFVMIGPEAPLVEGLTDLLQAENIPVFGPTKSAARLEGSKAFMKELCKKYDIPTAAYARFDKDQISEALDYIKAQELPLVVKADGLAAGKGVVIAQTYQEAAEAAQNMLSGKSFGTAGEAIVIEEFLDGEEVSFFALADGKSVIPFGSAQDHKRAYDGDKGPNTGGMGTVSPAPLMSASLHEKIMHMIIDPVIRAMAAEGAPFAGVLFAGLMVENGTPKLLEINTRFGDPECQSLMMRYQGDLLDLLFRAAKGEISESDNMDKFKSGASVCVVMAAKGYPAKYEKNTLIKGIDRAEEQANIKIFHAGTVKDKDGMLRSNGGRVLGVTARGASVEDARRTAYDGVDFIDWPEGFCRYDIGLPK